MSFLLILVYIFCMIIRPQDWVFFCLNWPVVYWLAIAIIIMILLERMISEEELFMKVPQNIFMVALYFSVIMSHVTVGYFAGLIQSIQDFLSIFLLFFIFQNSLNEKWKVMWALRFIIFLVALLVYQGIDQAAHGYGWAGQSPHMTEGDLRITWIGIFADPNDLALMFVVALGFLLPSIFDKSNFLLKILYFGLCSWLGYGVYLTNSRGGFLALLGTIFFFFIKRTNHVFWGSIVGGIVGTALIFFGPSRIQGISGTDASSQERMEIWYQGIQAMAHRPFFGVGYNMFMDRIAYTAHNSFILVGTELGFIGLCVWVGLIYVSCNGLGRVYKSSKEYASMAIGVQSGIIGFCCAAFFLSRAYIVLPYTLFALAGAIMYLAKRDDPSFDWSITGKDLRNIVLLSLGLLAFVYILFKIKL